MTLQPLDRSRKVEVRNRELLARFQNQIQRGKRPSKALTRRAREAYRSLGSAPFQPTFSLKDYDHIRLGPFLGVSDEGSAASDILAGAVASPKCSALPPRFRLQPDVIGVALDAERLGGVGETAVGPDEYADIWVSSVGRLLMSTNVGTRVNLRIFRNEPRVELRSDNDLELARAQREISDAFRPFTLTPDSRPRPLTVFIEFAPTARMSRSRKVVVLRKLVEFVRSGKASNLDMAPEGHALGLAAQVGRGVRGKEQTFAAIELASAAKIKLLLLEGIQRRTAARSISLAGLFDFFPAGLLGPILRRAKSRGVKVRAANLPDTETIARGIWSCLRTARSMGVHLGKYGCFPLTLDETDSVVAQVQSWFGDWSAAPVFFVDQGLLREDAADVERDLPRGIEIWLSTVAARGVTIVLLDTVDKASGRQLLKKSSRDMQGYLSKGQVIRIERHARKLGLRVLWAGGLGLRDAFEMGRIGVFGVYITSAVACRKAVPTSYASDPMLSHLKEPHREGVLSAKTLLEAGFLSSRLDRELANNIATLAESYLCALETVKGEGRPRLKALSEACIAGWRTYWGSVWGQS